MTASIEPCTPDEFWSDDMTESPRMGPLGADLSASEAQEAPEVVGRAAEVLARVLRSVGVEVGYAGADTYRTVVAERILADPGPLLEALAEAGVLEVEEEVDWCEERCPSRDYYGEECGNTCRRTDDHPTAHECVNGHYFPREPDEVVGTRSRRYTAWQEDPR